MNGLFAVGVGMLAAGVILIAFGTASETGGSSGGFILVGPFPIVFGTGSSGGQLALFSVVLGLVMIFLLLLATFRFKRVSQDLDEETDK